MNLIILSAILIFVLLCSFFASKSLKVYLILFAVLNSLPILFNKSINFLNFSWELCAIISIFVILIKFFNNAYSNIIFFKYGKILLWFVFSFLIIFLFSYLEFGINAVKWNRTHLYPIIFLVAFAGYRNNKFNRESFLVFLRVSVFIVITMYLLRIFNILPDLYGVNRYYSLRFITNDQTLFLMMFYIYISRSKLFKRKVSKIDNSLYIISFFLILTSTQRMVTLIFVLYLIYDYLTNVQNNIKNSFLITFVVILALFSLDTSHFLNKLNSAFSIVFTNFEQSHGYSKLMDIFASTQYILDEGKILFGRLFQATKFERSLANFHSAETRGIHNLYVTYFVAGGLFLVLPFLTLIFSIIKNNYKYMKKNNMKFHNQVAFIFVFSIFLFSNSSGAPMHNAIVIGYAILISRYDYDKRLNSQKK